MVSTSPPTSFTSAATSSSSPLLPEASTSLPPRAPSVIAQPRPNAPDAPVTIATLPLLSNNESGCRSGSEISLIYFASCQLSLRHPEVRAKRASEDDGPAVAAAGPCILRGPCCARPPQDDGDRSAIASSAGLEAERLRRVERRHHAQRAALAVRPAPRERKARAPLAGELVDLAADVLDAGDAVGHHDLVRRFPVREVVDDVAAGLGKVFVIEVRLRGSGPVRPEERAERMVERLHVDADELHAAFDNPFRRLFVESRRIGVVVRIVAVVLVAAGVDHHDVVLLDFRLGVFQILRRD